MVIIFITSFFLSYSSGFPISQPLCLNCKPISNTNIPKAYDFYFSLAPTKSTPGTIIFEQHAIRVGKRFCELFGWQMTYFRKVTETWQVLPSPDFPMAQFEANYHAMPLGTFQNKIDKAKIFARY